MQPKLLAALTLGLVAALPLAVRADDGAHAAPMPDAQPAKMDEAMTPELKKDMADMYQKMAVCMRTDKSVEQCSQDAMKNCPVMEKTGHCPINEGMGAAGKGAGGKKMKHGKQGMQKGGMGDMGMGMGKMKDPPDGK